MDDEAMRDWLQRIGHHLSLRLNDGRRVTGFLLYIADQTLEIRESPPGEWNSLAGAHVTFTFDDIQAAFDNTMEEIIGET